MCLCDFICLRVKQLNIALHRNTTEETATETLIALKREVREIYKQNVIREMKSYLERQIQRHTIIERSKQLNFDLHGNTTEETATETIVVLRKK